jgi:hypothetical protein
MLEIIDDYIEIGKMPLQEILVCEDILFILESFEAI